MNLGITMRRLLGRKCPAAVSLGRKPPQIILELHGRDLCTAPAPSAVYCDRELDTRRGAGP